MYLKHLTLILLSLSITSLTLAQCPNTDIFLSTQADIDNFSSNYPGCTMIPTGINVTIDDNFSGGFTNLNGLSGITSIGGDLIISNIFGLPNLDGLSGLASIGGDLYIGFTIGLTNIDGLSALTSVGGDVTIQANDFPNLDGLSGVTSIGGNLFVDVNITLNNIDGLSALTSVGGDVIILGNDDLTSIDGLSVLTSIGGGLFVELNSQLSMCCTLCPILQADANDDTVIGGTVDISNNAAGCEEADVLTCPTCVACAAVDLAINFDGFPTQTSWEMTDAAGNVIASSGGNIYGPAFANVNLPVSDIACLADGCYDLTFYDSVNNGMCPFRATASSSSTFITPGTIITPGTLVATLGTIVAPGLCGNYTLTDANGTILASGGGRFGGSETTNFCVSGGLAVPLWQGGDIYTKTLTEDASNTLELLPNPAQDNLTIYYNLTNDLNVDIQVVDIRGKIVREIIKTNTSQTQVDISDLTSGFYFVKLVSGDTVLSKKFVKQD